MATLSDFEIAKPTKPARNWANGIVPTDNPVQPGADRAPNDRAAPTARHGNGPQAAGHPGYNVPSSVVTRPTRSSGSLTFTPS